ncbi:MULTISPECIES: polysaccharide biosynthesis tyrosine autokinase [unclassified Blastococcus]
MELKEGLAALRAAWWLPVLGLVGGVVAALLLTLLQVPQYTSHMQLFVSTRDAGTTASAFQGSQLSEGRVESYAELLQGNEVAGRVVERLRLPMSAGALNDGVTASAVPGTVLIDVSVTDTSAQRAQAIAAALAEEFRRLVSDLEAPAVGGPAPVDVTVTDAPTLPTAAQTPQPVRNVGLGLIVGTVAGAGAAVLRARLDSTVSTVEEAARLTGKPVIGSVPHDPGLPTRHVIDPFGRGAVAESYRQVRTTLQRLHPDDPPKTIMVTSAAEADGRTTTAVNLALSLAEAGRQVALVDADLRNPEVGSRLRIGAGPGLSDVLGGTAELAEILQRHADLPLTVVVAGPAVENPGGLLASENTAKAIDELRWKHDVVIIDASALLPVADAGALATHVDGVILCVRHGHTGRDELVESRDALDLLGVRTIGVVLNDVPW